FVSERLLCRQYSSTQVVVVSMVIHLHAQVSRVGTRYGRGLALTAGAGALPGRLRPLAPELPRGEALDHLVRSAGGGFPDRVLAHRFDEPVGDPDRVVRVLSRDRAVRVAVEVRRIACGDQRRDLLLLARLPLDEFADLGMIDVEHHHLRRPARDAARLGGPGRLVENLEEAHQPGAGASAREPLHLPAEPREVRSAAGTVLEDPGLVVDQVEDRVEVVAAALDEAGRYLRPRVCVLGRIGLAGGEIDRVVPAAPLDLVLMPAPAVEPDRADEC